MSLKNSSAKWHSSFAYSVKGAPASSEYAVKILYHELFSQHKGAKCLEIGTGKFLDSWNLS